MLLKLVTLIAFSLLPRSIMTSVWRDPVDPSALPHLPPHCAYPDLNDNHYIRCENDIPDFSSFNRTWLDAVDTLTIAACASATITRQRFQPLRKVQFLHIDCAELAVGDGHAFDDLTQLAYLEMQKNLVTFPRHFFCKLKTLEELNVNNNKLNSDEAFGLGNCSKNGQQLLFCASRIRSLYASNNAMTSIKKDGFLCNLKSLTYLDLKNNLIETIDKEAFVSVPNLKDLDLAGNLIKDLTLDIFRFAKQLNYLDLSNNRLSHLPAPAFKSLRSLFRLNLSGNLITSLNKGTFNSLMANTVDLSRNRIKEVKNAFQNSEVSYVDLSGNQLETIDAHTLGGLRAVTTINLSHNAFRDIAENVFDLCPNLKTLDLSYNRIRDFFKIGGAKSIENLFTDHNEL